MTAKTDIEVIIGGKVYTLTGYESGEYMQRVANYLNNKYIEYQKVDSFKKQPPETQSVLLQLNIADDFFKAKREIEILEAEKQEKEKELYDLKHELISYQIRLEGAEEQVRSLQHDLTENMKEIVRLETELGNK